MKQRKCICEICTCGRHRCPHQPTGIYTQTEKPCLITEYVDRYHDYGLGGPRESFRPQHMYQGPQGKMDGITTFRADYIPYEAGKRPVRPVEAYKPVPGTMSMDTTYKTDFNEMPIHLVLPARPMENQHQAHGKMDTIPTYQNDYRQWEILKRENAKPNYTYVPSTNKYGYMTTFQDDYHAKQGGPSTSFKPANVVKPSEGAFEDRTTHRSAYVPHQLEARFVREPERYKPSMQQFDSLTTFRRDFQSLGPQELMKSFKPEHVRVGSDDKFNDSTEFKDKFKVWPLSPPPVRQQAMYHPPTGTMDTTTTSHDDYVQHRQERILLARPISRERRLSLPFDGHTTMREAYKPWAAQREPMIKHVEQMQRSLGKFEDMTTFREHYVPLPLIPLHSYKPKGGAVMSSAPFESGTMYRSEYTPKKVAVCPASYPQPLGYAFQEKDTRGHLYFRRLSDAHKMQIAAVPKLNGIEKPFTNGLLETQPKELMSLA
ncbi:unnamed protein product [Lampetra planeri]